MTKIKKERVKSATKKAVARVQKKKVAAKKVKAPLPPIFDSIDSLPRSSDYYIWLDFIELRCVTHPDRRFSRGDLLELLADSEATGATTDEELNAPTDDEDFLEDGMSDDTEDADDAQLTQAPLEAERLDASEARVADLFRQLEVRAAAFGTAYPFELSTGSQEIILHNEYNPSRGLYLQLLLSSSLRMIPQRRWSELTNAFEDISYEIFRGLMPGSWEVHQFGAKRAKRYTGHLYDRLLKLSEDWRGQLGFGRHHLKTRNSGDGGLDLVAWHSLGDEGRPGIPAAAAQCGCAAEEWPMKMLEASPSKLRMTLDPPWATYYFMPIDLFDVQDGKADWQALNKIAKVVVIDRLRIVRLAAVLKFEALFDVEPNVVAEAKAWRAPGMGAVAA